MAAGSTYGRILGNGAFVRLLVAQTISAIGDWLYMVAMLVVVYQVTQDALILGLVGAVRLLPWVLLSVPAGVAADRFDRRSILIVTSVARAVLMLVLAILVSTGAPVIAIVLTGLLAAGVSAYFGPAIGAYLPTVVGDERDLGAANSLWATLDNVAFFIGPAVAGLRIAAGGLGFAFVLDALCFGCVVVVLSPLPRGMEGAADRATQRLPTGPTAGPTADPVRTVGGGVPRQRAPEPEMSRAALLRTVSGPLIVDGATTFASQGLGSSSCSSASTSCRPRTRQWAISRRPWVWAASWPGSSPAGSSRGGWMCPWSPVQSWALSDWACWA